MWTARGRLSVNHIRSEKGVSINRALRSHREGVLAWRALEWDCHGLSCVHMQEEKKCRYVHPCFASWLNIWQGLVVGFWHPALFDMGVFFCHAPAACAVVSACLCRRLVWLSESSASCSVPLLSSPLLSSPLQHYPRPGSGPKCRLFVLCSSATFVELMGTPVLLEHAGANLCPLFKTQTVTSWCSAVYSCVTFAVFCPNWILRHTLSH